MKRLGEESKPAAPTTGSSSSVSASSTEGGVVCEICRKTKFADGIGHQCHYCGIKSCARCGGKSMLRTNKVSSLVP